MTKVITRNPELTTQPKEFSIPLVYQCAISCLFQEFTDDFYNNDYIYLSLKTYQDQIDELKKIPTLGYQIEFWADYFPPESLEKKETVVLSSESKTLLQKIKAFHLSFQKNPDISEHSNLEYHLLNDVLKFNIDHYYLMLIGKNKNKKKKKEIHERFSSIVSTFNPEFPFN